MTSEPHILTTLLAQRSDLDLSELAWYGAILLVTVIGGIIQKLRKEPEKGKKPEPGPRPTRPRPTARAPQPTPPDEARPREVPARPARPAPAPRRPVQARPPTARPQHPPRPEPPPRPQPTIVGTPATYTPEQIRWLLEQRRQAEQAVEVPVEAIEVKLTELAAEPTSPERPAAAGLPSRVRQLLGDRAGLQAGFVLSEVLAPPLALRQDQPR